MNSTIAHARRNVGAVYPAIQRPESRLQTMMTCSLTLLVFALSVSNARAEIDVIFRPQLEGQIAKVTFINRDVGVAMGFREVYNSSDRGSSWLRVHHIPDIDWVGFVDVSVNSSGRGMLIGRSRMWSTIDSGRTWAEASTADLSFRERDEFFRVHVGTDSRVRIVTARGYTIERMNETSPWISDTISIGRELRDVTFPNDSVIYGLNLKRTITCRKNANDTSVNAGAPNGLILRIDGDLAAIAALDKVWISRDRCSTAPQAR